MCSSNVKLLSSMTPSLSLELPSMEELLMSKDFKLKGDKNNDILKDLLKNYCGKTNQRDFRKLFPGLIWLPKRCSYLHNLKSLICNYIE